MAAFLPRILISLLLVNIVNAASPPYGQLSVKGTKLVGSNGQAVALHGMSLFWSQWTEGSAFFNLQTVQALKSSWNSNLVRAVMGIENGGYLSNPSTEQAKLEAVVQAAISVGIYVIIDWHDHNAQSHTDSAVSFFSAMSKKYGSNPNIIYEDFNEPLGVSWTNDLVPYHKKVIAAIRANDPNNVIVLGTPTWSQDVDVASQNPITGFSNIMYTLHYYAASHKAELRAKAQTALNNGIAIFVTEYGTVDASGGGSVDQASSEAWWTFLDNNKISYANWAIDNKAEGAAALNPGTTASQVGSDSVLTASGKLVKAHLVAQNNGVGGGGSSGGGSSGGGSSGGGSSGGGSSGGGSSGGGSSGGGSSGGSSGGGSSASGVSASVSSVSSWSGGGQYSVTLKNSGSSAVCSVTVKISGNVNSVWNLNGPSNGQYTTPGWLNIPAGGSYNGIGMVVSGSAPSVNVVSASSC